MIKEQLVSLSYAKKRTIQIICDVLLLWLAMWVAFFMRLGSDGWLWPENSGEAVLFYLAPLCALPFYVRMGMYRAVMRYFGNDALSTIFKAVSVGFLTFVAALAIVDMSGFEILRSRAILFMYWCLSLGLIGGLRLMAREYFTGNWFTAGRPMGFEFLDRAPAIPVAIYGAGEAGNQLLASIRVGRVYRPVAFVDDDANLEGRMVSGLPVYSACQIDHMIRITGVQELFLAIPSASKAHRQKVLDNLQRFPLHVRTVPGLTDIASGKVKVEDLQEVDIADLLGREEVPPRPELFEACILDKAVMVTGAGGSIGSELCRQIMRSQPKVLVLFEHSEFALYSIQSEIRSWIISEGMQVSLVPILGSIRNASRVEDTIRAWNIDTIYHAAAYKHVPIVEHNVAEGIMNNVFGTLNVAQAAIKAGVHNFVLISTDKAVRPTNVMGSTKRLAELILQALSAEASPCLLNEDRTVTYLNRTRFTMVRFGNVLGSSGSVIPLFRDQIRAGGPVTVTHADVTRYFMTIPEAAQLVIQAGALGRGGDVLVLDMGEPVNIVELARKMITLSGLAVLDSDNPDGDIAISLTGLRPGEKLFEELLIGERPEPTSHQKIFRADEDFLRWDQVLPVLDKLQKAVARDDYDTIRQSLLDTVQGYKPADGIVDLLYEQHRITRP